MSWVTWVARARGRTAAARHGGAGSGGRWLGLLVFVRRPPGDEGWPLIGVPREPVPPPEVAEVPYGTIVVPMKQAGPIEDEMVATAVKLAAEHGAEVHALHVIYVPLELELDADLAGRRRSAAASLAEAAILGFDLDVTVVGATIRARAIGRRSSTRRAAWRRLDPDGSLPRWRGQARFFSPTIEYLLRRAHCRVIVMAFPPGTASIATAEEPAAASGAHGH